MPLHCPALPGSVRWHCFRCCHSRVLFADSFFRCTLLFGRILDYLLFLLFIPVSGFPRLLRALSMFFLVRRCLFFCWYSILLLSLAGGVRWCCGGSIFFLRFRRFLFSLFCRALLFLLVGRSAFPPRAGSYLDSLLFFDFFDHMNI